MSKVVIIGSGNVATVLGIRIAMAGHEIVQVFSRKRENAALLAGQLHCPYSTYWTQISQEAELYLVALSDGALLSIGESLSLPGKLVMHTAGAVSKDVLLPVSKNIGVLYPLQSLRKEIRPFPPIPLLVDANTPVDKARIADFAGTLSGQVQEADDITRLKLHLGAVLVNNFSNHLYTLTEDYCRQEKIDFTLLLPIIQETASRLAHFLPRDTQTGPAIRGDGATIEKHLQLLHNYKNIKELYELFTHQIQQYRTGI
jgi:predicted short-subunit dehydrogenase-like oxidoreductase (DUF2520 family)